MKKVLTIAGSDCSGGAGIQADIKTITVHKMYAMSIITALTAQNTMGVSDIMDCTPDFLQKQFDAVFTDIFPDAVKIGMLSNTDTINTVQKMLKKYNAKNIVLDPVMISTSGYRLLSEDAQSALIENLLPMADVITPNLYEAQELCGFEISCLDDMKKAAELLSKKYSTAALIKGGHFDECADFAVDVLCKDGRFTEFSAERIDNKNTHGTGCTLSSAIACGLAGGLSVEKSIERAKNYLTGAIKDNMDIGKGRGPLNHSYVIQ